MSINRGAVLFFLTVLMAMTAITATADAADQWDTPNYTMLSVKQNTGPVETETALRDLLAASFDDVDTNHDGQVSYAEALAALPGLTQDVFDAVDTNGDGQISREEAENCGGCFGCSHMGGGILRHLGDLFLGGLALFMMTLFGRNRDDDGTISPPFV